MMAKDGEGISTNNDCPRQNVAPAYTHARRTMTVHVPGPIANDSLTI